MFYLPSVLYIRTEETTTETMLKVGVYTSIGH